jgi:hypothetical protein
VLGVFGRRAPLPAEPERAASFRFAKPGSLSEVAAKDEARAPRAERSDLDPPPLAPDDLDLA